MNKRFSRSLYDECDGVGKREAEKFLVQLGYTSYDKCDEELFKKGDFYLLNEEKEKKLIEVELKLVWKKELGWETKWEDIHIPMRKKSSKADIYIMFNYNCTCLAMMEMEKVKQGKVINKHTCYMNSEDFISVPYEQFQFFSKEGLEWTEIRRTERVY